MKMTQAGHNSNAWVTPMELPNSQDLISRDSQQLLKAPKQDTNASCSHNSTKTAQFSINNNPTFTNDLLQKNVMLNQHADILERPHGR
jgi:hypothetical protein